MSMKGKKGLMGAQWLIVIIPVLILILVGVLYAVKSGWVDIPALEPIADLLPI